MSVLVFKNLLDMMIAEEEGLRKRLTSSIESCQKELAVLCEELQLSPYEASSTVIHILHTNSI